MLVKGKWELVFYYLNIDTFHEIMDIYIYIRIICVGLKL